MSACIHFLESTNPLSELLSQNYSEQEYSFEKRARFPDTEVSGFSHIELLGDRVALAGNSECKHNFRMFMPLGNFPFLVRA